MSPELEKQLFEKYPEIFADANKSPQESCMAFGLEVGDGWYNLLDTALRLIQSHIDIEKRRGREIEQVVFEQVKEKFGMLTIYHRGGDEYTRGVLRMAEEISRHTCEECGKPGYPSSKGWIRTLCDEHHAKYNT